MGLDITYYKNAIHFPCAFDSDGEPIGAPEKSTQVYVNRDFEGRADGMIHKGIYSYDECEGFRAGSYSGYNNWREQLAKLAGYTAVEVERYGSKQMRYDAAAWNETNGPFFELILMSDCEGTIGPITSAKLAKDFADFQSKADTFGDDYWRERYANWRTAFEAASQNGFVSFH